jgi:hypothetical protein
VLQDVEQIPDRDDGSVLVEDLLLFRPVRRYSWVRIALICASIASGPEAQTAIRRRLSAA